jgi:peroxiredoxin
MKKIILPSVFLIALILLSGFSSVPAPEKTRNFTLKDLSGNTVSLDSYKGRVVLLVFFKTGCPACQDLIPQLEPIYQKYRSKKFDVILIDVRENANIVRLFARENKLSFTILLDEKGEVMADYKVRYYPGIFIFGRSGEIEFGSYYIPAEELEIEIKKALQ